MEKQNHLKKIVFAVILASIVSIILGVVMLMLPNESLIAFSYVLSCFFVVFGITLIVLDIKAWAYYVPFHGFLLGALNVVVGIMMFTHPEEIYFSLAFAVGTWAILSSIEDIRMANILRRTGIPFGTILILNILNILAGIFMLFYPASSSISIVMVCGIGLIVNGIVRIVDMIMIKKEIEEAKNYIREITAVPEHEVVKEVEEEIKEGE